jgi:hypothetical protein
VPIFWEKWRFSQKLMIWSNYFQKIAEIRANTANVLAQFYCRKLFKDHNIGPGI